MKGMRSRAIVSAFLAVVFPVLVFAVARPKAADKADDQVSIKKVKVVNTGDGLGGIKLGPIVGKDKFYWGFRVHIHFEGDIDKAKELKQEMYLLVKKVPLDPEAAIQYDIYTGTGNPSYKKLTPKEFADHVNRYDKGSGEVEYHPDKDKASILNAASALVKIGKDATVYVDGPGLSRGRNGKPLPAKDYATVELYMKFRITAKGTDGKEVKVEFFRYQIGFPDDGEWVVPPGATYSGNSAFPLEKTP